MSTAQVVLVFLVLVVVVAFILIYSGQYKPPNYPGFGR